MTPSIDLFTRLGWRTVGRPVDLAGQHTWLDAPTSAAPKVRDGWMTAYVERLGGSVHEGVAGAEDVAVIREVPASLDPGVVASVAPYDDAGAVPPERVVQARAEAAAYVRTAVERWGGSG